MENSSVQFAGEYAITLLIFAIVCSIGAKPNAKRTGIVHVLFNLFALVIKDPRVMDSLHNYARYLHSGEDRFFNEAYKAGRDRYFGRLESLS